MTQSIDIIYSAIDELNTDPCMNEQLEKDPHTPLFGSARIDSFTLVSLLINIEEKASQHRGRDIGLFANLPTDDAFQHLTNIQALANYLDTLQN